jgi:hypothetical protein
MSDNALNRESDISHHLCSGLPCACDTHSDNTICGTLAKKILGFNEVDRRELALAIDPSLAERGWPAQEYEAVRDACECFRTALKTIRDGSLDIPAEDIVANIKATAACALREHSSHD